MRPELEMDVDVGRSLVRTRLAGFFDEAAIGRYLTARAQAFTQLRCPPNGHVTLIDIRDMSIQTQDIVGRWSEIIADPASRGRRLGFIVATTLARAQLQRALGNREARCFTDPDAAEAWVLDGGEMVRAA